MGILNRFWRKKILHKNTVKTVFDEPVFSANFKLIPDAVILKESRYCYQVKLLGKIVWIKKEDIDLQKHSHDFSTKGLLIKKEELFERKLL
jgi:hypothetical protein